MRNISRMSDSTPSTQQTGPDKGVQGEIKQLRDEVCKLKTEVAVGAAETKVRGLWIGILVGVVGVLAAIWFGVASYRDIPNAVQTALRKEATEQLAGAIRQYHQDSMQLRGEIRSLREDARQQVAEIGREEPVKVLRGDVALLSMHLNHVYSRARHVTNPQEFPGAVADGHDGIGFEAVQRELQAVRTHSEMALSAETRPSR